MVIADEQIGKFEVVDVNQFEKLMLEEGFVLVDVRTDGEVDEGFIPGAVQIDISQPNFESRINELDKKGKFLVYCKVGGRSARASQYMQQNGFVEVYDLKGGFLAWKEAGKEIETREQ